jgi:X box-binding protein 1
MVDILIPTSGSGVRSTTTTATVKTIQTEAGPQQIIVIPQSLFQTAVNNNLYQNKKQMIKISPAIPNTTKMTLKRPLKVEEDVKPVVYCSSEDSDDSKPMARKRANLDHLSSEEKMMRRKLKNRVAAQNARDKKRVRMDSMEDCLKKVEDELEMVQAENKRLNEINERLFNENQALKGNNSMNLLNTSIKDEMPPSPDSLPPPYSPAPSSVDSHDQGIVVGRPSATADHTDNGLQQQDQGRPMAVDRSQQNAAAMITAVSACCLFWTCLTATGTGCSKDSSSKCKSSLPPAPNPCNRSSESSRLPPKKRSSQSWWGPQQTSWNPAKT